MKICFHPGYWWDFSAATLPAEQVEVLGVATRYRVWCPHCLDWHYHGPSDGHREAHCRDPESPFWAKGYNVELCD